MLTISPPMHLEQSRADHAAPALAGTLLLTGLACALPFSLFPSSHTFYSSNSCEILNLNFMVAWMGLAHFVYAYSGQARALFRARQKIAPFLFLLLLGAASLLALRQFLGYTIFSFLMWIYFLPHFVRAEILFTKTLDDKTDTPADAGVYIFPALAFAFFTFALFGPIEFLSNKWNLILLAEAALWAGCALNLQHQLKDRLLSRYALLAVCLIAEGLVWATYRQYMTSQFQQGIYIVHIAMASFYHYLRAYDFARQRSISSDHSSGKKFLFGVLAVNCAVIMIGYLQANCFADTAAKYIFDVSFFTFWVGLHQYASDVFGWLKRQP